MLTVLVYDFYVGIESEGLYRVAGFHDDVEAIKMSFDKGLNLSSSNLHSIPFLWCVKMLLFVFRRRDD